MKIKMPKLIALIFSLILAIVAVYFLFLDTSSSIDPMAKDFSFGRVDKITEFHLTDKNKSITLTKTKSGWLADGKYMVKDQLPELFLSTINTISVRAPASKEIRKELRDQFVNSKHIDIFKGNHKVCSYYILFDSLYTQATYVMKKWAKLPLEAEITSLQLPIASLYHCDMAYWKARYVFPFSPENIEWVSFENKAQPMASFRLERIRGAGIKLTAINSKPTTGNTDPIAASDYFSSLTKVQYLKEAEASDSLDFDHSKMQSALYVINLKIANQDAIEFKLFPFLRKGNITNIKNSDLFIGESSLAKAPLIGRYTDFDPIIRSINYFLSK
jgi:hypothetical protein